MRAMGEEAVESDRNFMRRFSARHESYFCIAFQELLQAVTLRNT